MFDVKKFLDRNNWTLADLAKRLFGEEKTSRISNWKTGAANPRYAQIVTLINLGITAEELLGEELAKKLMENSGLVKPVPKDLSETDDFKNAVQDVILELKKNGKI